MNLTNQIPQNVRRRAPAVGQATFEFSPFDQDVPMQIGLPDGHVDFLDALETTVAATLGASHGQGNTVSGQGLRSGSTPADTPNHYLHHVRDPSNSKGFRRTRKSLPTRHASVNIRGCAAYRRRWCGADIRRWLGSPRAGRTG
jgi:hypothetical protein